MTNKIQNIVFVGDPCFPNGGAMTKRWRYLVDFLNDKQIISHVLCTCKIDRILQMRICLKKL